MNEHPPQSAPAPVAPLLSFSGALADLRTQADANHSARTNGERLGPATGLPRLDKEISNALAPGLHGIYGNAGAGKTALALQIASDCGFPALYVTCEMAPSELLRRHTARATQTFLGRLKSGELTGERVEELAILALQSAPDIALLDATRAPASAQRILDCARITKGDARHVLLIVDSLHSWAEMLAIDSMGEYETLNAGILALRKIAHELSCPIIFLAERNREGNKKGGGGLNSGAGSRKIEYGAETVLDLDRNMEEQPTGAGEFPIKARLVKNRHGSVGVEIPMLFHGALQQFREGEKTGYQR